MEGVRAVISKVGIRRLVNKVKPATEALEKVASIAVHLRKPSVIGVAGAASAGLNELGRALARGNPGRRIAMPTTPRQTIAAVAAAGAQVRTYQSSEGASHEFIYREHEAWIESNGSVYFVNETSREWLRGALDAWLPEAVDVHYSRSGGDGHTARFETVPAANFTAIRPDTAGFIWRLTAPMVDGDRRRCVLITGKPGTGKTTTAQAIAVLSGLGRAVSLPASILSHGGDGLSEADIASAIEMLSPGVVIVDDVDKVRPSIHRLERLRGVARLVILTANNGEHDAVLDGAFVRAGRVDEVFEVRPAEWPRRAPLDRLSPEEWDEVKNWPVAFVREVEERLTRRPDADARLEDLRARLALRVRSGDVLL